MAANGLEHGDDKQPFLQRSVSSSAAVLTTAFSRRWGLISLIDPNTVNRWLSEPLLGATDDWLESERKTADTEKALSPGGAEMRLLPAFSTKTFTDADAVSVVTGGQRRPHDASKPNRPAPVKNSSRIPPVTTRLSADDGDDASPLTHAPSGLSCCSALCRAPPAPGTFILHSYAVVKEPHALSVQVTKWSHRHIFSFSL
ncbi:unnamed protein product [Lota lota]